MPKLTKAQKDMEGAQAAAFRVGQRVIEISESGPTGLPVAASPDVAVPDIRNPAAVALSALGASKGGKARAKSLTKAQRSTIARLAAKARWHNK